MSLWDDPHEARTMRELLWEILRKEVPENVPDRVKREILSYAHKAMYAQSWTVLGESDALWRAYSQDKMGVRISVDRKDIFDRIRRAQIDVKEGQVVYCSPQEALNRVGSLVRGSRYAFDPAICCFYKRVEFEHEREYRFCATMFPKGFQLDLAKSDFTEEEEKRTIDTLQGLHYEPVHYYSFDPSRIREVTLDPRAPDWFLETVRNFCSQQVSTVTVGKSRLYEPPTI
jgi:hypothetical protein